MRRVEKMVDVVTLSPAARGPKGYERLWRLSVGTQERVVVDFFVVIFTEVTVT